MKKLLLVYCFISFFSLYSFAQLDKGTWLVGGNGSFNSSKNTFAANYLPNGVANYQITSLKIMPNIGYFITDKFVGGIKVTFDWYKNVGGGGYTNNKRTDYGMFTRYYFLNKEKDFNILIDGAFQLGNSWLGNFKGTRNNYSIMGGPSIFFNSSVAIEFLAGYLYELEKIRDVAISYNDLTKGFQFRIGLQIHLKK